MDGSYDVVVVGAGNAALCAALSAKESGASVLVLERAPEREAGGNSRFTAGAMRFAYSGVDDILALVPDLTDDQKERTDFGHYTSDQFLDDMARVTEYRCDPDLTEILVKNSFDTLKWMHALGVRFLPIYGRQAYEVEGRFKFWGGLTLEANGGGYGLVDSLLHAARKAGIHVEFGAKGQSLIREDGRITGIVVRIGGVDAPVRAGAVVLACGGFESNAEWRTRYLGPGWDLAKVRGTKYNDGSGIRMALEADAMPWGQWSGCHAVGWDLNAPVFGDIRVGDSFQKHSYPLGVLVNARGERFVDEGADFRNYTYAKYGRRILEQPGQFAWQIFDAKVAHLLRDEYRIPQVTKCVADTLEGLARKLDGVDAESLIRTIRAYNDAIDRSVPFNPNVKDSRHTIGLTVPKSNWANTLDTPPFEAYGVTCGITFTFGGLRINRDAAVFDSEERTLPGLFACGELVGGIFYLNYPGGSGLTSGAVFGRIAGRSAAAEARGRVLSRGSARDSRGR